MFKKIIILLILLNNLVLFSQNHLSLDSLSTTKRVTSYLKYYQDFSEKETIQTIQEKEFLYYGNKNFPLEYQQKMWFKTQVNKSEKNIDKFFFILNTISIGKLTVYQDDGAGYKNKFEFVKNGEKEIEIPIHLLESSKLLFEVKFTECVYFPLEIASKDSLNKTHHFNLVIYGLYYGFVLIVIIINLFFYKQTKEQFFLYYVFLTLCIALILFELDGFVYLLFGELKWITYSSTILDILLLVSIILFTQEALQLKKYMPRLRKFGIILIIINILSYLIFQLTDSLSWYSIGEFSNLIGTVFYWFLVIWFIKKLEYARFLFLGYTLIIVSNIIYVLPSEFGLIDFGFTPTIFKIGSAIEMLVLLYAISYRHKILSREKEKLEEELEEKNKTLNFSDSQKLEDFKLKLSLSKRELEVLSLIIKGKNNKEIAEELHITEATVKYHCTKLYLKTCVKNRSQLTALFNSNN